MGAFLIIWLVTERLDTLNTTILALLGISSCTSIASRLTNAITLEDGSIRPEPDRAARRHKSSADLIEDLGKERKALNAEADALRKQQLEAPVAGGDARLVRLCARIQRLNDDLDYLKLPRITRFFMDLLGENGSVTVHRLQVLVWTLVLGVVFITKVKSELSMPVFSDTLLGLMGLSSATYIALKVPELKKAEAEVNAASKEEKK